MTDKSDAPVGFEQKTDHDLEREIQTFACQRDELMARIRELTLAERPRDGLIYAQEIHEAKHEKIRVETEILCRQQALRRRSMSVSPMQ